MIKAIIVDDEQITRKGLIEFVDWSSLDIEVVGEATDGQEGLELCKKVQPEIAICDVRMPKMDGIELAKNIRFLLPQCKVIFLSGYSDTDYLKSAIKLKAVDYIEKPFNLVEFQELLKKTVDNLKQEKQKYLEDQRMKIKMEKSIPYFKNTLIASILQNENIDKDKIQEGLDILNINFPLDAKYMCCILKSVNKNQHNEILEVVNKTGNRKGIYFISGSNESEVIILLALRDNESFNGINSFGNLILMTLNDTQKLSVSGAFGSVVSSIKELNKSYEEAQETIKSKGYKAKNTIIIYDPNKDKSIIRDIESYIQDNYQSNISINAIASSVYLTPQYLCKLYKKETGETVNDYITKVRIEQSKRLLRDRRYKLYEIAEKVGYNDANYYARVFKKITGLNPSEYRDVN